MSNSALQQNIIAGAGFAALNACMLAGMSLFSKLLSSYFGPIEVTFLRNLVSFLVLAGLLLAFRRFHTLKTKRPFAHIVRSSIGTAGIIIGMWALAVMPLTETTLLLFTSPLFVVLLSYPLLKEPVGLYRIIAVLVGFSGVAVMIAPANADNLPWLGIVLGLIWGFSAGCVDISLRWLGSTENSSTTTFYFTLFGVLSTGLYWPFSNSGIENFTQESLLIVLGLGLTGVLALMSKTQSYRLAPAASIAPITYTMIIWASLFDYLIWDKTPSWNVALGAAIIIASNLFILWREKIKQTREHN